MACYPTDGKEIELVGTVVPAVYKTEENIAHYRALEFDQAYCFSPDGEISEEEVEVKKVQLIIPDGVVLEVGGKYQVRGVPFHWHTGHHYTKIVISVNQSKKL